MASALPQPDPRLVAWEANHRSQNTLAALRSLLHTDFGDFSDPSVRDAVTVFSSRIRAFASVHRALSEEPGEKAVDAGAHLARLCQALSAAHLAPRGLHCELRLEPAVLAPEVCHTLGLIVVELVTNAARHAFIGRTGGRVWVTLRRSARGWMCQVADNGTGQCGGAGGGMTTTVRLHGPTVRPRED